ncbi:hypothetical protein BH708_11490 [Brachybacterium sp. P6-10-X1]|uniref:hypothetical protein n=1 Tax=Brachybacterium sp. P6-10-X1 TaxID=1903186 RepID=UPI000971BB52|nr:hypothetical protein [Brachybacterium sp. P6-10-X1]APX33234.1 hypothetical protein BH708_11490 [Brachybacterium sp. P6-10-X1]
MSALAVSLGACVFDKDLRVVAVEGAPASTVLPDEDPAQTALALSSVLFASAEGAVIAIEDTVDALAGVSSRSGLPLLIGTDQAVAEELGRLGAETIVTAEGTDFSALGDQLDVVEIDPADAEARTPTATRNGGPIPVSLFVDPEQGGPAQTVARAQVAAAGGAIREMPGGAPGRSSRTIAATKEAADSDPSVGVLALGATFGPAEAWISTLTMALSAPELPGGGSTAFPGRRMIAAYGSPGVPSLGILGEQGIQESIDRVQGLADDYAGLTETPVVPAFEIITTLASSEPGSDGDYSTELDPESLREWVDMAGEAGVYVVLDLQPGTSDFLSQAKRYEDLLKKSHVGLALDAEWRLQPGQKHLEQIGSVSAAEVNETARWLADVTAENDLPQKVLILHQFSLAMITDRQDIDASRPELAISVHADGHGTPDSKLETWHALQNDLPDGIFMAWKNFYDEDTPTFTPEQTYDVEPRPWFVSYQ